MKHKLTTIITSLVAACGLCGLFMTPAPAYAAPDLCTMNDDIVPPEVKQAAGCGTTTDYDLGATIQNIINGVILVLGTLAVVIIVIGGISYMTSSGDAGKLKKAKDTILYACVGLVICVLSFAIVNFTINIIGGNTTTSNSASGNPDGNDDDDPEDGEPISCTRWDPDLATFVPCEE